MSLRTKILKGIAFTSLYSIFIMVISLVFQVVKARYLETSDFAILAAMFMLIMFSNTFTKFGLSQVIIKNQLQPEKLISYIVINTLYAFTFIGIIFLASPLIERAYHLPNKEMLYFVAFIVLLNVPTEILKTLLEKSLLYGRYTLINSSIVLINVMLGWFLLVHGFGIHALYYSYFLAAALDLLFTLVIAGRNVSFKGVLQHISFKNLFKDNKDDMFYAFHISNRKIVNVTGNKIDEFLVGILFTGHELGIYFFAKDLFIKLTGLLNTSISKIILPVFALTRENAQNTQKVYFTFIKGMTYVGFPAILMMCFYPTEVILALFGEKWIGSAQVFTVLTFGMFFALITSNMTTSMLTIFDKVKQALLIELRITLFYLLVLASLAYSGLDISIVGVAMLLNIKIMMIAMQNHNMCMKIMKLRLIDVFIKLRTAIYFIIAIFVFFYLSLLTVTVKGVAGVFIFAFVLYLYAGIMAIMLDKNTLKTALKRKESTTEV